MRILEYISVFLALIIVLPVHEFAHAFVAVKCGDITPKLNNRYTLNPLAHFDLMGLVCFVLVKFGWAKPMPVNPYNFRNYKKGCFLVSVAGIVANLILSFLIYPLFFLLAKIKDLGYFDDVIKLTAYYVFSMGISFSVFNLIPLYPLDGFRVVEALNKKRGRIFMFLRNYGTYILYGFIALGFLADITGLWYLDILGNLIGFISGKISFVFSCFWEFIYNLFI